MEFFGDQTTHGGIVFVVFWWFFLVWFGFNFFFFLIFIFSLAHSLTRHSVRVEMQIVTFVCWCLE